MKVCRKIPEQTTKTVKFQEELIIACVLCVISFTSKNTPVLSWKHLLPLTCDSCWHGQTQVCIRLLERGRRQTSTLMIRDEHMLSSTGHGLALKTPLCKTQGIGGQILVVYKINESPGKSRISAVKSKRLGEIQPRRTVLWVPIWTYQVVFQVK